MARLPLSTLLSVVLLLKGISIIGGQEHELKDVQVVNLCNKRLGFEPNGERLDNPGDELIVYTNWTHNTLTRANHCRMRFSTCSDCNLHVQANASFDYSACGSSEAYQEYDGWCVPGCSYIHLYDKDYSNQTAATFTSSSSIVDNYPRNLDLTTMSSFLYVIACANRSNDPHVFFQLKITAKEKVQYFKGNSYSNQAPLHFTSPLFPSEYVLNSERYKYVFQAASSDDFITISFDDWHLSQYSVIQFDKANINGMIRGSNYRPWIISEGPRLEMVFDTGPDRIPGKVRAFKGFRATYTFHRKADQNEVPYVNTNCGRWIELQETGQIIFNSNNNVQDYYDCIWVIKKHFNFQRVMIKVVNYTTQDSAYRHYEPNLLEVREGLTSLGRLVVSGLPSIHPNDRQKYMDHDSSVGFYVRLKGHYWRPRDFVLTFTSFNLDQCRDLFRCLNGRCVPQSVQCNTIDNCGDSSDESFYNCGTGSTDLPSGSGSNKSFLSPVIIIPTVVTVIVIIIICLLIIIILRCRRLSRQARQAQRQQGRMASVSGTVAQQHPRRHHRRRGEQRMEGPADQYHLHPDLPPSYEDVLSTTPIGYLNLGFSGLVNQSTGLIQPPSYDEATSPTATQAPTLVFPGAEAQDESSDSSVLETARRSLSTSYSSDDTRRARADQHRQRGTGSSSSSDSSNEGEGLRGEASDRQRRGRRGETGHRDREGDRQIESEQDAHYSVAKPEECRIALPGEIAHNKVLHPHKKSKPGSGQDGENRGPAVITEFSASTSMSGPYGQSHYPSSVRRVETSPTVSAPSTSLERHCARYVEDEGRASSAGPSAACSLPPANSSPDSQSGYPAQQGGQPFAHLSETSPYLQQGRDRPSPTRQIPAHILKARNASSHTLMKNLSRSMNDLDRQPLDGRTDHEHGAMPSRHFSRSMQNMLEGQADRCHRDSEHRPSELNRHGYHHGSQGMLNNAAELEERGGVFPAEGQARRSRLEDFADNGQPRSDPQSSHGHPDPRHKPRSDPQSSHGHPDPKQREHSGPELLQRERARVTSGEGPALQSTTRPKPQPKPRRLQPSGGRARPEPRQRQSPGGHRNPDQPRRPNDWCIPHSSNHSQPPLPADDPRRDRPRSGTTDQDGSSRNVPKHYDRRDNGSDGNRQMERGYPADSRSGNQQSMPGGSEREDVRQAKSGRPSAPPRPHGAPRPSSRGQDRPQRTDRGDPKRYEPGRDHPPGSPGSLRTGPPPPHRQGDPPPYRARDRNNQHPRPTSRTPPVSHWNQAAGDAFHPLEGAPRPRNPPPFAQTTPRSAGPLPAAGTQSALRSGQQTAAMFGDASVGRGSGTGDPRAGIGSAPTSPHRSNRSDATAAIASVSEEVAVTSLPSVVEQAAPFLSLQLGGPEEEEQEDIYV